MTSTTTPIAALVVFALAALSPMSAIAQPSGAAGVMSNIRDGGGWVTIPIEDGVGHYSTARMPTGGLTLRGCVTLWPGHSGTWEIDAVENVNSGRLEMRLEPGKSQTFSHAFGMQAQMDFDFRWSEPRDTTLMLWVGIDLMGEGLEKACEPRYAGSG